MATSGSFLTSAAGHGQGANFWDRAIFQWSRTGWGYSGAVGYHNISWSLKTYNGNGSYYVKVFNGSGSVNGAGMGFVGSGTNAYGNQATTLASGSFTLYTNSSGNASFSASAQMGIYYAAINSTGSGSWSLDNIPIHATLTSTSGNISDEANPYISYTNPGGHSVTAWLTLPSLTGSTAYATRVGYASGSNFSLTTGERNAIRSAMANVKSTTLRYNMTDTVTGQTTTQNSTITIINANPVFTTIGYHDSNSTTTTITGDNQAIIQDESIINLDINSGDAAIAQKSATMVSYTASIGGLNKTITYTGSTINEVLGEVALSTNQTLSVTAIDSRGNTTTVEKAVTIIPYSGPVVNAVPEREDGFGEDTTLYITATYSPLIVSSVEKNVVDTTTGIGYKIWEVGDSEPGSYTDVPSTSSGGTVTITTAPLETLDRDTEFNLKVQITDILSTRTNTLIIPRGIANFRIATDGKLYNNGHPLIGDTVVLTLESDFAAGTDLHPPRVTESAGVLHFSGILEYTGSLPPGVNIPIAYFNPAFGATPPQSEIGSPQRWEGLAWETRARTTLEDNGGVDFDWWIPSELYIDSDGLYLTRLGRINSFYSTYITLDGISVPIERTWIS